MSLLHKKAKQLILIFLLQAAAGISHLKAQALNPELAEKYVDAVYAYKQQHPHSIRLDDPELIDLSGIMQQQVRQAAADSLKDNDLHEFQFNLSILYAFANAAGDQDLARTIYDIKDELGDEHWRQRVMQAERFVTHVLGLTKEEYERLKQTVDRTPVDILIEHGGIRISYAFDGENRPLTVTQQQDVRKVIPYDVIVAGVIQQTPDASPEYRDTIISEILDYLKEHKYVVE